MLLPHVVATALHDPLLDPASGDRTVGADVVRLAIAHPLKDRLADLHRVGEELLLDAPRSVVPRASLDGVDRRAWNSLEELARLLADVLHARMTGHVVADVAERLRERLLHQSVALASDEILEGIEHRFRNDCD